jgi:hypothetical protein
MAYVRGRRFGALALLTAMVSFNVVAWSQSEPLDRTNSSVQLEFVAPDTCAQVDEFADKVHGRSERIQFEPAAAKHLTISIRGEDAAFSGRASFAQEGQPPLSREIKAHTCDEVIEGLALVTVMVLDPDAFQQPADEEAHPPAPPVTAAATATAIPVPATPPAQLQVPRPVPTATHARFEYGLAGVVGVARGPAPNTLLGFGASAHAGWQQPHHLWSPQARLTFTHSSLAGYATAAGTADFALNSFTLGVCPIALRLASLHAHPCAAASLGQLTAAGTRTFVPATERLLSADVGGQLPLVWNPIPKLEVFVMPALGYPLKRYAFTFAPHQFYRQPAVLVSATAGIGLQID